MADEFDFSGKIAEENEFFVNKEPEHNPQPIQRSPSYIPQTIRTQDRSSNGNYGIFWIGVFLVILIALDSYAFYNLIEKDHFKPTINQPISNQFNATINSPTNNAYTFNPSTTNEYASIDFVNITIINKICINSTNMSYC